MADVVAAGVQEVAKGVERVLYRLWFLFADMLMAWSFLPA
jgi:hypothetical protein